MVGVAQPNRERPVNLLQKHNSDQLMRQSHGPERNHLFCRGPRFRGKAVGSPDEEGESLRAGVAVLHDQVREPSAGQGRAALVEGDPDRAFALEREPVPFLAPPRLVVAGAPFRKLDHSRTRKPKSRGEIGGALPISLGEIALRAGFQPADGANDELQCLGLDGVPSGAEALRSFGRTVLTPHLLEIVEGPDVRSEDMDDEIARIDQDPIA
jgi:hypothetical protein